MDENSKMELEMEQGLPNKVVIIGAGVAGMNVAYQLMSSELPMDITCITREPVYDYSTCGMPYVLEGVVAKFEDIILHQPDFFTKNNVKILKNIEVVSINLSKNQLHKRSLIGVQELDEQLLDFDYLIIATGRAAVKPTIPGLDLNGVYTLMNYTDGEKLYSAMSDKKQGVIIGGGIIGLEVAVGFYAKKIPITVIELASNILPTMLDSDMGQLVTDWLVNNGINIITSSRVARVGGSREVENVIIDNGDVIPADIVLLSTGIKPNSTLAQQAGLDIGNLGGLKTDQNQRVLKEDVPVANVFALGDCVEVQNLITDKPMISALASTALIQANVVANNILGRPAEVGKFINPTITMLAGLQIGSVGLTCSAADRAGLQYKTATSVGKSHSRYYPDWKNLYFKFLGLDGRLIGAQIIGEEDVKERINYLTLVIKEGIEIEKILKTERCYTPPLALLTDPMIKALKKLIS